MILEHKTVPSMMFLIRRSQEEKAGGGTKAALFPKGCKARWLVRGSLLENHTFCK
ncbi:hypothetical protein [Leptospira borgpetersenii]|uniref:hypothetical protein n=1 Tax=Leptospira borgpetersenii TaxID=174 RepID=UPI002159A721|nr:hypothetical protein [Leptospira borgpetersenii]UVD75804.1 hypothetical protein LIX27_12485 [Leptospira borgpetersenii]UZW32363.1 hypothetical protein OR565_12490 [Leptospira borgpetersenii]